MTQPRVSISGAVGGLETILETDVLELRNLHANESEAERRHPTWKEVWPQLLAGCIAMCPAFLNGLSMGFTAAFLPQLISDTHFDHFSKNEASWTASLLMLAGPLGGLSIGPIMDILGRRAACIIINVPTVFCWVLTYFVSDSLWPLYIARVAGGCAGGMIGAVSVYVSETCHTDYRPMMLCLIGAFVSLGSFVAMVAGAFVEWHQAAFGFGALALLSLASSFFLPESPSWLVSFTPSKRRLELALREVTKLNRPIWMNQEESRMIEEMYITSRDFCSTASLLKKYSGWSYRVRRMERIFKDRAVYAPIGILLIIFGFLEMSGIFVVLFYATNIFESIGSNFGAGIKAAEATMMVGAIRFVMTMVTTGLSLRVGRRPLMIVSSLGMAIPVAIAGLLQLETGTKLDFTEKISSAEQDNLTNLTTIVLLLIFVLFATIGHLNIPWALISELLPTKAKALGNGLIVSYAYLFLFLILKVLPYFLDVLNLAHLFLIFSAFCFASAAYIYKFLPETFRKNSKDMENYFRKTEQQSLRTDTK